MGFIYVDVEIACESAPHVTEKINALVDTGATLSVFPAGALDKLGVERLGKRRFHGFGGAVARDTGIVRMRYQDVAAGVTVIFGAEDDPPIMGVTALDVLGYQVDPVAGRLNRVEMLML